MLSATSMLKAAQGKLLVLLFEPAMRPALSWLVLTFETIIFLEWRKVRKLKFLKRLKYDINIFHINADQTPDVFNSLDARNHQGRYNIGFWFWELEDLPIEYLSSYSYLDEIWVASTFCQDAISKHANIPVTLIPLCVDLATENLISKKELDLPEESFFDSINHRYAKYS